MGKRDKEFVDIICNDCGAKDQIKFGSWRRKKEGPFYCSKCRNKHRFIMMNDMTEEEKRNWYNERNKKISQGWNNRSEEEKASTRNKRIEIWANRSDEEREKMSDYLRDRWKNYSDEQRQYVVDAMSKGRDEYHKNQTLQEFEDKFLKSAMRANEARLANNPGGIKPNDLEVEFMNLLKARNIKFIFSWFNTTKGEGFDEKFQGKNPTGARYTSPYHAWDFLLEFNDKKILIDLDGSMHGPFAYDCSLPVWNGKVVNLGEATEFGEAQRPYQTDGLDAYIIKAYRNALLDDIRVEHIQTKVECTFKQFLTQLEYMNAPSEDQRNVLKDMK